MTQPVQTPNPATSSRPDRSSQRVARKKPLGWLPWLLLLALIALAALIWWGVSEAVETSPTSRTVAPAAVSSPGPVAAPTPAAPTPAAPTPAAPTSAATPAAVPPAGAGVGSAAAPAAGGTAAGPAGVLAGALIGGAGLAPTGIGKAGAAPGTAAGTAASHQAPGTAGTVLFAEASPAIDANGNKVIAAAARNLKTSGAKRVEVRGYTDVLSGPKVNTPLSRQRADNVANALRALLPGVAVTGVGKDTADPVGPNNTAAGRQQNRRAAILAAG